MKDWRNSGMRPFIDKHEGCRRCSTASGLKKLKDAITKSAQKLRNLWQHRKENKND